jgi:N-acyl-phosphatidylethanolamine-hydrolysing phospholipase D
MLVSWWNCPHQIFPVPNVALGYCLIPYSLIVARLFNGLGLLGTQVSFAFFSKPVFNVVLSLSLLTPSCVYINLRIINKCLFILEPPVSMEEIPEVDAVVISHNHYDHMDIPTLTVLKEKYNPQFFAPLNNDQTFLDTGIEPSRFHCLDWWEDREITVQLPATSNGSGNESIKNDVKFKLTCTPSQHISSRTPFDRCHSLWSSWALEELSSSQRQGFKLWFGGDTGYRHVPQGTPVSDEDDETKIPCCPVFKEIGEKFGEFDLALIPIGAYEPRDIMSAVHASPSDAVRIFKDIKAKKALGIHWG